MDYWLVVALLARMAARQGAFFGLYRNLLHTAHIFLRGDDLHSLAEIVVALATLQAHMRE